LVLLIRRGREYLLNETCEAFLAIYDSYKKRVRVHLRTAYPLSEAVKSALAEKIQAALDAQEVILTEELQPSLIGGFVVEVGTRVADLSVRGQLQEIQKNLLSN
jgi:F-type H+-transporting ATPase subunit delta